MMEKKSWKKITVFLVLTAALSSVFYRGILASGMVQSWTLGLMWSPGLAALITQLLFHRSLRGLGWKPGNARWLLAGYAIPLLYGLVVYGLVWVSGIGGLDLEQFISTVNGMFSLHLETSPSSAAISILIMGTAGVLFSSFAALGEEIGWRGLLVPELARSMSFTRAALVSGAIWALWHAPAILFADYNNAGSPQWFSLLCFAAMVIGISFVFAWLRLRSGSVWPAVLLHASHNLFIQGIFTPLTHETTLTPWVIDEFGIGLALAGVILGVVFWRKGKQL